MILGLGMTPIEGRKNGQTKSLTPILKLAVCPLNIHNFKFNGQMFLDRLKINQRSYYGLLNSAF